MFKYDVLFNQITYWLQVLINVFVAKCTNRESWRTVSQLARFEMHKTVCTGYKSCQNTLKEINQNAEQRNFDKVI